jgi:pimeloyl-ACP methyl ester carboxylesterase
MNESPDAHNNSMTSWEDTPTQTINVGGVEFAYRQLGPDTGVPVVFLTHLAAVLDNWDPRVVDGIAAKHRVITFDNRGVGASSGYTPTTIEEMARDAVTFIRALGLDRVDLFGFSMGGMIAQVIAQQEPQLVRKMILAGTGPAGGEGIDQVTRISLLSGGPASACRPRRGRPVGVLPRPARHVGRQRWSDQGRGGLNAETQESDPVAIDRSAPCIGPVKPVLDDDPRRLLNHLASEREHLFTFLRVPSRSWGLEVVTL